MRKIIYHPNVTHQTGSVRASGVFERPISASNGMAHSGGAMNVRILLFPLSRGGKRTAATAAVAMAVTVQAAPARAPCGAAPPRRVSITHIRV